jgi:hypothetical protein
VTCSWCKGRDLNDHDCSNFDIPENADLPDLWWDSAPRPILEKTQEANRGFAAMTTPITVVDGVDGLTPDMLRRRDNNRSRFLVEVRNGAAMDPIFGGAEGLSQALHAAEMDPFSDDTPIVASCDLENPESCESCT